jgi:flagellar basal-body rod protein FlgG
MEKSVYTALFGAMAAEHRLDIIANNLANVNTTGFKREKTSFRDTFARLPSDYAPDSRTNLRAEPMFPEPQIAARVRIDQSKLDFTQGHLRQTGNPLDLAISGDGFFKVKTPQGDRYTRNGNFYLSSEGGLITAEGFPVLGDGNSPITLPGPGKVTINPAGQIFSGANEAGKVAVVGLKNPADVLEKEGRNLFRLRQGAAAAAQEAPVEDPSVSQGFLESANIEVVEEMVGMIEVNRAFEAYQKVMTGVQSLDDKSIRDLGTTR